MTQLFDHGFNHGDDIHPIDASMGVLDLIVSRKESAYRVETSTEVRSGGFLVGPLSQRGNELNPGLYKLEVAMVRAADQPLSVQQVIGRQGEKLRGPLPSREAGGLTVRYATTLHLAWRPIPSLIASPWSARKYPVPSGGRGNAVTSATTQSTLSGTALAASVPPIA